MYTCCPHCRTCFRITKAQLDVAQGKVRCGQCKEIYNARLTLHDSPPVRPAPPAAPQKPAPTPAPAAGPDLDLDLFAAPAAPEPEPNRDESNEEPADIFADTGEFEAMEGEDEEPTAILDSAGFEEPGEDEDSLDDLFLDDEPELDSEAAPDLPEGEIEPTAIIETGNVAAEFLSQFGKSEPAPEPPSAKAAPDQTPDAPADQAEPPSRYQYVDPEDLIEEEKDIAELLEEMNAQLDIPPREEPAPRDPLLAGLDVDANPDRLIPPAGSGTEPPPDSDEFEESFLASLDATMTRTPPAPPPKAAAEPEPPPPPAAPPRFPPPSPPGPPPVQEEDMPLRIRETLVMEKPPFSPVKFIFGLLAVVVLCGGLLVQLAVFRSSDLLDQLPALQPVVDRICARLPCRYTGPRDVSRIKLVNRDIRLHPTADNALLINATFVNRAPFRQPYPILTITLSDLSGAVVARRSFTPAEYLGQDMDQPYRLMPSGQPVRVTLEVVDPGKDAVNFEFTFSDSLY